jgi:hypothetical protein
MPEVKLNLAVASCKTLDVIKDISSSASNAFKSLTSSAGDVIPGFAVVALLLQQTRHCLLGVDAAYIIISEEDVVVDKATSGGKHGELPLFADRCIRLAMHSERSSVCLCNQLYSSSF